ncbi:MAG: Flp pilus assembly complex ATPase component [bacterium]|nr:Flp pilus assembly complex ATPase component [bacterium]
MAPLVRLRIGEALVERGYVTEAQVAVALDEQKRVRAPLGEILVALGFVRPDQVAEILAGNLGVPLERARDLKPDPLLISALETSFVRASGAFPLGLEGGTLRVAMTDPGDPEKVSQVRARFPYSLAISMITEGDLDLLVRKHLADEGSAVATLLNDSERAAVGGEFPIEEVTLAVLYDGVRRGATDVHIEPEQKITRVRYRIDGVLHGGESLPREETDSITSRIKILSNLDIAERRRPQDGHMRIKVDGRDVDLRVSIMPATCGENCVLRILDRAAGGIPLAALGIRADTVRLVKRIAERPHGLFLVTGPTGSGKTTTLYSLLGEVDSIRRNVATVEDPVEYDMPLIRQSQVDVAAGFTFHDGLRALLRQDPDVILVGEIRDNETADLAIKASMTGHLVFSTLHTNSAIGAVPRLADLDVPPYLIEDALIGVMAQRLVRKVCEGCAAPRETDDALGAWLGDEIGTPRQGTGCEHCHGTGLAGRTVVSELFLPDDGMADALRSGHDASELRALAKEAGFLTMVEDGKDKVRRGLTTMEEVQRVERSHRLSREEREAI